jgi:hypothetical protein
VEEEHLLNEHWKRNTMAGEHLSDDSAHSCPWPHRGLNWIRQFLWLGSNAAQFNSITLYRKKKLWLL